MSSNAMKLVTANDLALVEFLPAALEVQQKPPSPIGRAIIWTIAFLFVAVIAWACIGEVDIVATAHGKIIPSERVKIIQPLEIGIVTQIHVRDGDLVERGDALITLDTTQITADMTRMERELEDLKQSNYRLAAYRCTVEHGKSNKCSDKTARALSQWALLQQQAAEYRSKRYSLITQQLQSQAARDATQAHYTKLELTLPLIEERVASLEKLLENNLVARHQVLELQQLEIEQQQDLIGQAARLKELGQAIKTADYQLATLRAETLRTILAESHDIERRIAGIEQEYIKKKIQHQQHRLLSPIDGRIQELAVTTLGGVVTPAQALMKIVPSGSELEVEAMIANQDIGFIEEGQQVAVKLDAFPFTKYGLIGGEIKTLSRDAYIDENLGLVFLARVLLHQNTINVNGKEVRLTSGMNATVEVKTGHRKLIEYFLAPLLRYRQESIRER